MRKLALAFSLAVVLASSPAAAQTTPERRYIFYSDDQKTEVVGYRDMRCDGTVVGTGYVTLYFDEEYYGCP